jgi:hypothetical protein
MEHRPCGLLLSFALVHAGKRPRPQKQAHPLQPPSLLIRTISPARFSMLSFGHTDQCNAGHFVRINILLCMLAYYVEWHMHEAWRELTFADADRSAQSSRDPVAPAQRSPAAKAKVSLRRLDDGAPDHSFQTLMADLSTLVRNTCRVPNAAIDTPPFEVLTTPTPAQRHALDLIERIGM